MASSTGSSSTFIGVLITASTSGWILSTTTLGGSVGSLIYGVLLYSVWPSDNGEMTSTFSGVSVTSAGGKGYSSSGTGVGSRSDFSGVGGFVGFFFNIVPEDFKVLFLAI